MTANRIPYTEGGCCPDCSGTVNHLGDDLKSWS